MEPFAECTDARGVRKKKKKSMKGMMWQQMQDTTVRHFGMKRSSQRQIQRPPQNHVEMMVVVVYGWLQDESHSSDGDPKLESYCKSGCSIYLSIRGM
jgi:hypothetical protein